MKKLTQKQLQMINNYKYARYDSVDYCYKKPSYYKQMAESKIFDEMYNNNGYDYRICGFNSCTFSCAYRYKDNQGYEHLVYHTHCNRFDFIVGIGGF